MVYTPPTNISTATQMITWVNSTTSMWLFQGIISSVFIISLVSMLNNSSNTSSKSFAAASFIAMMLSVFSRVLDLIPTWFMSIWTTMVGLSAIWMYIEGVR